MSKVVISTTRKIVASLKAVVYTDGSCLNQGSPNAQAGFGVYWGEDHPNNQFGRVPGVQDNCRSEIYAVIQAMTKANKLKYHEIVVYTDSEYVLYAFENLAKPKKPSVFNGDLYPLIQKENEIIRVDIKKVKAHSGVYGNEQAHLIARAGARKEPKRV